MPVSRSSRIDLSLTYNRFVLMDGGDLAPGAGLIGRSPNVSRMLRTRAGADVGCGRSHRLWV
jgi:hypothetical protein